MPADPILLRTDAASFRREAAEILARARREAKEVVSQAKAAAADLVERGQIEAQILISRAEASELAAARIERLGLRGRNDSGNLGRVDSVSRGVASSPPPPPAPPARPKGRRGPRLTSDGPIADAANAMGISVRSLAALIGEKYPSMRTWDRRKRVPAGVMTKIAEAQRAASGAASKKP